jgi:hypothetical protein
MPRQCSFYHIPSVFSISKKTKILAKVFPLQPKDAKITPYFEILIFFIAIDR